MPDANGNTIKWRITNLEKQVGDMNKSIGVIKDNELSHLKEQINQLSIDMIKSEARIMSSVEQNKLKLGIIIGIAVFVANLLLKEVISFI